MKTIILKRIVAFIIDWVMIFLISFGVFLIDPNFSLLHPSVDMLSSYGVILGLILLVTLPLCKDFVFRNASIGKCVMRLRVIDEFTHKKASIKSLLLRNMFHYMPIIDLVILFANRGKSLGDMISHTTIVNSNKGGKEN